MQKRFSSLIWLIAVIFISALVLHQLDQWEERRENIEPPEKPRVEVLLVGYDGEDFPAISQSGSYVRIGCNDVLIPSLIPVVSKRFQSVMAALSEYEPSYEFIHNPMQEKGIAFQSLTEDEKTGTVTVQLNGEPLLGGICDTPRLKAQIEENIKMYLDDFEIHLNGNAKNWECLGDESGLCL